MRLSARPFPKKFFVPEVIQTSMMDCGPASLKALLGGFGVHVSYGRLREACQTDVDGTSIDTLEELAVELGLDAEQVMIPPEHVLLDEAGVIPAITVVRLPGGLTHFVVAWNRIGERVQVMDPASGRRWLDRNEFLQDLYLHTMPVPASAFCEFAQSESFLKPLEKRLRALGMAAGESKRLLTSALASGGWRDIAVLEAGVRMVESLVGSGSIERGVDATRLLGTLYETQQKDPAEELIPAHFFTARPAPPDENGDEQVLLRGAVLVRTSGPKKAAVGEDPVPAPRLSPEVAAAIAEKPVHPAWELWRLLRQDGLLAPSILAMSLAVGAIVRTVEIVLFRGLLRVSETLIVPEQRLGAIVALIAFLTLGLSLEWALASGLTRLGRRLEMRLRMAFFRKIPRLGDRYFQSRPISDMAHRSHALHVIHDVPTLGAIVLRTTCDLVITALAIVWIDPKSAPLAALAGAFAIVLPMLLNGPLVERDLRLRTHAGALFRFYLDALLGLVPIRAHAAERAIQREHESLLVEWVLASRSLLRAAVGTEAILGVVGFGIAAVMLAGALGRGVPLGQALLLLYWALLMPTIGQTLAQAARDYPHQRNTTLRLLEPLGAVEESSTEGAPKPQEAASQIAHGVRIDLENVQVKAGGHVIIDEASLTIEAGKHVAIVGPSGAGKSSLVGLLLGWHKPVQGQLLVDGMPLDGERLDQLRKETVWLDPAVQLWNRSFLENLRYGSGEESPPLGEIIDDADLFGLLERLPEGQATVLGEGGGLVSGGEGQRVRFGRALHKAESRLVILDEPFRGLDREKRRVCLARARQRFARATFLCITHDVAETREFDRVLVIEGGRIVEDASPEELQKRPDSRYRALLEAEEALRRDLWAHPSFRRMRVDRGNLIENAEQETP